MKPAEAPQDASSVQGEDEEWCDRGCTFHWRVEVSSGSLVILDFQGSEASGGQAYLSEDEAESIANALNDCARVIRKAKLRGWDNVPGISFHMEHHDTRSRPKAKD